MAKVQYVGPESVYVRELGRTVDPDEIVEVPDDRFEGYVPAKEHRSDNHPWSAIAAPASAAKKSAPKVKDN